jgi:hypothetical protein
MDGVIIPLHKFQGSSAVRYGIRVILVEFHFDERKSGRLEANPRRGVGFEEAQEVFLHPYHLDQRSDLPRTVPGDRLGGGVVVHRHFPKCGRTKKESTTIL